MRGAAIFGNVSQCGFDGFADIRRNRYRGAEGRNERRTVHAVITMRQRGITYREVGGEVRPAGTYPAVQVGSDLSTDPFVPGVIGTFGQIEARLRAVHEFVGHLAKQGLVGGPFGRPGGAGGQQS